MKEYIKLEELKDLILEYHQIQKQKEKLTKQEHFGKDLLPLIFKENHITDILNFHSKKFLTSAIEFQFDLRDELSTYLKIENEKISIHTDVKSSKVENQFAYKVKMFVNINKSNIIETNELANFIILSKDEISEYNFSHDLYEISLLPILLNLNLKHKKQIFNACFKIIEKQYEDCLYK